MVNYSFPKMTSHLATWIWERFLLLGFERREKQNWGWQWSYEDRKQLIRDQTQEAI